ncbi:hypothetical protein [Streptomyces herbicida]|uniref:hypothetical protein n=1 Tax=Streptomyces herbicida TaxID=3065675 RepID=UPI0029300577|nr:hypothetical protein [Streptomyces sp. NEAU-HV9]
MPPRKKVSPQKKQTLKQKVAKTAEDVRNTSAAVAATAAATAATAAQVGAPEVSAVAGAVMAVAGILAVFSTVVQKLANDPPRDDFDEVWVSAAAIDEDALPEEEPLRTAVRVGAQTAVLTDNYYALLRALERYDGAVEAGEDDAADTQADAVQQNGDAVIAAQQAVQDLAAQINDSWATITANTPPDHTSLTLDDMKQQFLDNWGDPADNPANAPSAALQSILTALTGAAEDLLQPFDVGLPHPVLDADSVPDEPSALIDTAYQDSLADAGGQLPDLVFEEE